MFFLGRGRYLQIPQTLAASRQEFSLGQSDLVLADSKPALRSKNAENVFGAVSDAFGMSTATGITRPSCRAPTFCHEGAFPGWPEDTMIDRQRSSVSTFSRCMCVCVCVCVFVCVCVLTCVI